jgi:hypothetical protein
MHCRGIRRSCRRACRPVRGGLGELDELAGDFEVAILGA